MGKKHFKNHHQNEPRIKKCLLCLIKEQNDIIIKQTEVIGDLRVGLNKEEDRNDILLNKIEDLEHELQDALEAKKYYKDKSKRLN